MNTGTGTDQAHRQCQQRSRRRQRGKLSAEPEQAASCQYNDRLRYCWADWTWKGSAGFLDAEMAALVAPRALFLEAGEKDELFAPDSFLAECKRAEPFFDAANAACRLKYRVFNGNHEFWLNICKNILYIFILPPPKIINHYNFIIFCLFCQSVKFSPSCVKRWGKAMSTKKYFLLKKSVF